MKTYAQENKKKPFDWTTFLKKKNKTFNDWATAENEASSWVTCACGNQCSVIPRASSGVPVDSKLATLGFNFTREIRHRESSEALKTLRQIEKRSTTLIAEIRAKYFQALKDSK